MTEKFSNDKKAVVPRSQKWDVVYCPVSITSIEPISYFQQLLTVTSVLARIITVAFLIVISIIFGYK